MGRNRTPNVFGNCPVCKKDFSKYVRPNLIAKYGKNRGKFCSWDCFKKYIQTNSTYITCGVCGIEVLRSKSKLLNAKHGIYFCSRKCKEKAQSLKGGSQFKKLRPDHYCEDEYSKSTYRKNALEFYGTKCRICGYDILDVIEVHHKDGNRENNSIENLDVLCPTHHSEYQYGIRKYDLLLK